MGFKNDCQLAISLSKHTITIIKPALRPLNNSCPYTFWFIIFNSWQVCVEIAILVAPEYCSGMQAILLLISLSLTNTVNIVCLILSFLFNLYCIWTCFFLRNEYIWIQLRKVIVNIHNFWHLIIANKFHLLVLICL